MAWHAEILEVLGSRRTKAAYGGLALASCLADATCFRFALVAVGVHPKPGLFLFAYAVAMITAMVPLLPAGLGAVETVVPALLHHAGVPLATALAGILAYRALATLLPAVCGTVALVRLRSSAAEPGVPGASGHEAMRARSSSWSASDRSTRWSSSLRLIRCTALSMAFTWRSRWSPISW